MMPLQKLLTGDTLAPVRQIRLDGCIEKEET